MGRDSFGVRGFGKTGSRAGSIEHGTAVHVGISVQHGYEIHVGRFYIQEGYTFGFLWKKMGASPTARRAGGGIMYCTYEACDCVEAWALNLSSWDEEDGYRNMIQLNHT